VSRAIPNDERTPGVVARYMARPPITPERMLGEVNTAQVIYRSDAVHPHHQANFRVFDPLDFLAEVSAHIPNAHEKTILFHGWYSNRTRGYRKQQGLLGNAEVGAAIAEERAPLEIRRSCLRRGVRLRLTRSPQARRARLIRRVYEVDPLVCPRCAGTMRIIAARLSASTELGEVSRRSRDRTCLCRHLSASQPRQAGGRQAAGRDATDPGSPGHPPPVTRRPIPAGAGQRPRGPRGS